LKFNRFTCKIEGIFLPSHTTLGTQPQERGLGRGAKKNEKDQIILFRRRKKKRIKENRAKSYPQLTATRCSEMKKGVAVKKVLQ